MSSDTLREKNGKSNMFSVDNHDNESAARTRPLSFEEIMLRRRNKGLLENVKDLTQEALNKSPSGSPEKTADRYGFARDKHDESSFGRGKHGSDDQVNVASRKNVKSTYGKEDDLTGQKDSANNILEAKSSAGLNNIGAITKEKAGKEMLGSRRKEQIRDNSEHEGGTKHPRDSVNRDRYAEVNRSKSERKTKENNHIGYDENLNEYHTERKHGTDRHDRGKMKKRLNHNSEELAEKKHHKDFADKDRHAKKHHINSDDKDRHNKKHHGDSDDKDRHAKKHIRDSDDKDRHAKKHIRDSDDKERHAEGKEKYDREVKRKYRNGDDETWGRYASRKQDLVKHHNQWTQERKERRENVQSYVEESSAKRRRSRSREREDRRRRRSPSFSPRGSKHTHNDGGRKELSMPSVKDISTNKHSDVDRNRVSTNGSSSHSHRHGGSTSGLGGYSPRKRKSEAAAKTPSPSKNSQDKKRAGWDLPPVGTDNPSPAFISSSFLLSNQTVLSNMQTVAATTAVAPAILKPLPMSFLNDISTGKNTATIDSVQLTQATRPMRRIYLENLPASASEKAVMDCFNNLLRSAGANHIQQAQPCISCILHKDRGQALVEFLTAEDASAALSFDGTTLFGSVVKIRRPKDYVEVATGESERSADNAVAISDVVIDSPHKIFVGGISSHVSSEMLMEIAGAFGSLKAYHFEIEENNGSRAFLEYVDHSVTMKACAGLNGMKLAGEVLTVVQAMPDAVQLENRGEQPSYGIPDHAKALLRKPTQVLKIKNVFAAESILSLSDTAIEEVLEDVRLECARFGTIKSLNVIKHSSEKNLAAKSQLEVRNIVDSEEASQNSVDSVDDAEPSFSEKAECPKSEGTREMEFCSEIEAEEDKVHADNFDDKSCPEQLASGTAVEDTGNKSIPTSIIQECPDHQDTPKDGPESLDNVVASDTGLDVKKKVTDDIIDLKDTVCVSQEASLECDARSELVGPKNDNDVEDDFLRNIFELGSVLVEYGRTEACCSAAHCLHGRYFDGRMVTVEYVSVGQYRARFQK